MMAHQTPMLNACGILGFVFGAFQQKPNHIIGVQSTWTLRLNSPGILDQSGRSPVFPSCRLSHLPEGFCP
jgi:hypothetical protein